MNEKLEKLESLLKSHDWFYEYSDDHRVWTKGHNQYQKILSAIRELEMTYGKKGQTEAHKLISKYKR